MDKEQLTKALLDVKNTINFMRESGMTDRQIIDEFGLHHAELGDTTYKLLQAIESGKIKPTDTLQSMAKIMGFNSHNAILYHLNILKRYGYIAK